MTTAIISKMNNTVVLANESLHVKNFADAMASSDDDSLRLTKTSGVKNKLTSFIKELRAAQANPATWQTHAEAKLFAENATALLKILNRRSKNLMPGHKSVNCSIGSRRDPHLVLKPTRHPAYEETLASKCLSKYANAFFGFAYKPESKIEQGIEKYKSSSVNSGNNNDNAFYVP